jgi:hypothetical protein
LIAQPADRIRNVPMTKTAIVPAGGRPAEAIHSAVSVGQSSSSEPTGLSSRSRLAYSARRPGAATGEDTERAIFCAVDAARLS